MKKALLMSGFMLVALIGVSASARAQGGSRGPDASTVRDSELERDSKHNLEVARHYYKLRKAYRAALARCEEVYAGNPTFSRIDEVLFIAGMSSLRLSEKRGKQAPPENAGDLREKARAYLTQLVSEFPDSEFRGAAEKELRALGVETAAKPKTEEKKQ